MKNNNRGPLTNIKVLEICQIAAGPFAGSLLADLGADVVKVERPGEGDGFRSWPPLSTSQDNGSFSENFASVNRNKRSIVIDLKTESGVSQLLELATIADVVLENFRPGVAERLGFGYEALTNRNPKIIFCSITGYGQHGPYAKRGAFDVTVQGFSGLMSVTGEEDCPPVKCGVPVGDFCAGLYGAYCISAALIEARKTGKGRYIDCSMLGAMIGVSALQTSEYFGTGQPAKRLGSAHPRNAPYQAFLANDAYFIIAAGTDRMWKEVCEAVGLAELTEDSRFQTQHLRAKNQHVLSDILTPRFRQRCATDWLKEMDERGVPCAPINTFAEVMVDPQIEAMELIRPLTLPNGVETRTTAFPVAMTDYRFDIHRPPPELGSHTQEVIDEWLGKSLCPPSVQNIGG